MKKVVLCALIGLVACNSPPMHFAGIEPVRVTAKGSTFELRRKQDRNDMVHITRVSREYAPRLSQQLGRRAEIAIESTYGCPVDEIWGDASNMLAILKCGEPDDLARIGAGPKARV